MDSKKMQKPHAICIPCPAQGHIRAMMHLAKLLHSRGFHITFVHTELNYQQLIRTGAIDPTVEIEGFCFKAIPDGLPQPEDANEAPDPIESTKSISKHGLAPLRELIRRINGDTQGGPPVSCMMRDAFMSVAQPIGDEFGIPDVAFWPIAGSSFMGFFHIDEVLQRGFFKAMPGIRLKDLPTFVRTADPNDFFLDFSRQAVQTSLKASAIILHTFEELDYEIIDAAKHKFKLQPPYAIGPLFALCDQIPNPKLNSIKSNLWKEERECIEWLDKRGDATVVYVNFGSVMTVTPEQLKEFAWGLVNSNHPFIWVVRPNLVSGGSAILEAEFLEETKGRGLIASWCAQKQVLDHPSVGGFLTHNGWNSTLESIHSGVPMLCWPFFGDQQMNCRFACTVWGNGMEIDGDVKREKVEGAVKELMEGQKGKEMRKNAMKWKEKAREAVEVGGSSYISFDRLVNDLLVMKR
ncbi:7-deoxyloganetin glucosyltransferase-like isoform X2 [Magnolia sinica]|uniref:7-deoxyloganetin glucosyltransferase-like isoform X2 n=1 Tax=Magnolia sinica TaxID=86752 RepID=UPI002657C1AB|nr:7-deoxyloganetin glucosyltransferase-like isoform X2 [Magnolia sinica]